MRRRWPSPAGFRVLSRRLAIGVCTLLVATSCDDGADGEGIDELLIASSDLVTARLRVVHGTRVVRLDAAPGVRINARLRPVLELDDGTRVAFSSDSVTADSSYFTGAPRALLDTVPAGRGILRASACPATLNVCRSILLDVSIPR